MPYKIKKHIKKVQEMESLYDPSKSSLLGELCPFCGEPLRFELLDNPGIYYYCLGCLMSLKITLEGNIHE